jgi:hypothetical protein
MHDAMHPFVVVPNQCFFYVLDPWRCLATKPHIAIFFGDRFGERPSHLNIFGDDPSTVKNLFLATRAFPPIKYGDTVQ